MNFDDEDSGAVREWVLQSAERLDPDFHVDGLRLDAIHAIFDSSAEHLVAAISRRVHAASHDAVVIAESGLNDPKVMSPGGGWGCDAAWADDFHHALRVLLTGDTSSLLRGVRARRRPGQGVPPPARARRHLLDLPPPPLRRSRRRGCAPERFVVFSANHDQVGNRAARRPAARRGPPAGRVLHAAEPLHADAVHGRRVRRAGAVPVLHRPHRRGDRRGDARGRRREFALRATRSRTRRIPLPSSAPSSRGDATPALEQLHRDLIAARRGLPAGDAEITFDEDGALAARAPRRPDPDHELLRKPFPCPRRRRGLIVATHAVDRAAPAAAGRGAGPREPRGLARAGRSRSARMWDGEGTNFSIFCENAHKVELCLFDADDNEERIVARGLHRAPLALLPARRRPRPALRLPRPRPLRPARRPPLQPAQAADRPVREGDRGRRAVGRGQRPPATSPTPTTRTPTSRWTTPTTPTRSPSAWSSTSTFHWEGDRRPENPWWETVIYETHVKGFTKQMAGGARGPARHLRRPGLRAGDRVPQGARRHRRRAAARPPHHRRVLPARERADQLLGLLARSASSRRTPATARPAAPASRCASSRAWSRPCTARASR